MNKLKKIIALGTSIITAGMMIMGCSDDKDTSDDTSAFITIEDTTISLDVGKIYAYNQQASYEAYYLANGYNIDWSMAYEEGSETSVQDLVKEEVVDRIKMFYVVAQYAKDHGATLSDEDNEEIKGYVENYLKSNPKVLAATGATEDVLYEIYELEAFYNKGCDMLFENDDFSVDEAELRQSHVYAVEINDSMVDFPKDTAKAILQRVQAGEDIKTVANAYGIQATEGNVGRGDFEGDAVENLCLSLATGESDIVEEDGNYLVVYCINSNDEEATTLAIEDKVRSMKQEKIIEYYKDLSKDLKITVNEDLWSTITFTTPIFTEDDLTDILNDLSINKDID